MLDAFLQRHDPDRYFCTLFAPPAARDSLFTLYAFNHELARAQEVASEPALAMMRLQWWREVVEGEPKRHDVAGPLLALIESGALPRADALALIDARDDAVAAPPATRDAFLAAMEAGPGTLARAAGALLGADVPEQAALRGLGAAYGVAGTLRNLSLLAGHGRGAPRDALVPDAVLRDAGLSREKAMQDPARAAAACGDVLRPAALSLAGPRRRWRRSVLAAALPGVWAKRDLARRGQSGPRGAGDRLAVLRAAAFGVV